MIDMRGLSSIHIATDGQTATIGGGARVKETVRSLWAQGKQTVTGICECVGISAPVLGGGHGWLQGQYGLAADQIVSARVVLTSGEVVRASEQENEDLFWALRGAGHNFGIVTEWEYRVYDVANQQWSYEIFYFPGEKLVAVIEVTKEMMKTQPPEVNHWMYIAKITEIDPDHPILWYAIIYDGPVAKARAYAEPLHALGPLSVDAGEASMPDLALVTFMGVDQLACAKGMTGLRYPIGLKEYNTAAVRDVYDEIDATFQRVPEISMSFFLLEGYSTQAVKAVHEAQTAFPHRSDEILVTSYVIYQPNASLDAAAQAYGRRLREILLQGSDDPERLRAYVNYAHGDEPLGSVYGWDDWRLEKLRGLKKKWDPENRMRYYVPFI